MVLCLNYTAELDFNYQTIGGLGPAELRGPARHVPAPDLRSQSGRIATSTQRERPAATTAGAEIGSLAAMAFEFYLKIKGCAFMIRNGRCGDLMNVLRALSIAYRRAAEPAGHSRQQITGTYAFQ